MWEMMGAAGTQEQEGKGQVQEDVVHTDSGDSAIRKNERMSFVATQHGWT